MQCCQLALSYLVAVELLLLQVNDPLKYRTGSVCGLSFTYLARGLERRYIGLPRLGIPPRRRRARIRCSAG